MERKSPNVGFMLLMLGLAVGGLGRSLHLSPRVGIGFSIVSILFSLSAMVVFYKTTPNPRARRNMVIALVVGIALAASVAIAVLMR